MSNGIVALDNRVDLISPSQALIDLQVRAELAFKSGVYKDLLNKDQAFLRMQMATELGLQPTLALRGLYLSKSGAVGFSAELLKTLVQASNRWKWKVVQKDNKGCVLEWYEKENGVWELLGTSSFTVEDQKKACLSGDAWNKYPEDMCFARAVTRGIRTYCPAVTGGVGAYDIEEVKSFDKPEPKVPTYSRSEPTGNEVVVVPELEEKAPSDYELEGLIKKVGADRVVILREFGGMNAKMKDLNAEQRVQIKKFLTLNPKANQEVGV